MKQSSIWSATCAVQAAQRVSNADGYCCPELCAFCQNWARFYAAFTHANCYTSEYAAEQQCSVYIEQNPQPDLGSPSSSTTNMKGRGKQRKWDVFVQTLPGHDYMLILELPINFWRLAALPGHGTKLLMLELPIKLWRLLADRLSAAYNHSLGGFAQAVPCVLSGGGGGHLPAPTAKEQPCKSLKFTVNARCMYNKLLPMETSAGSSCTDV